MSMKFGGCVRRETGPLRCRNDFFYTYTARRRHTSTSAWRTRRSSELTRRRTCSLRRSSTSIGVTLKQAIRQSSSSSSTRRSSAKWSCLNYLRLWCWSTLHGSGSSNGYLQETWRQNLVSVLEASLIPRRTSFLREVQRQPDYPKDRSIHGCYTPAQSQKLGHQRRISQGVLLWEGEENAAWTWSGVPGTTGGRHSTT